MNNPILSEAWIREHCIVRSIRETVGNVLYLGNNSRVTFKLSIHSSFRYFFNKQTSSGMYTVISRIADSGQASMVTGQPWSWRGRAVSHIDAPFSWARSIANFSGWERAILGFVSFSCRFWRWRADLIVWVVWVSFWLTIMLVLSGCHQSHFGNWYQRMIVEGLATCHEIVCPICSLRLTVESLLACSAVLIAIFLVFYCAQVKSYTSKVI